MSYSALQTIPQLSVKSREVRLLFAEVANAALAQGRSNDEAVFKGLASVKQLERQTIKKYVKPSVPAHLQAILNLKNQAPYVEPVPLPEKPVSAEITSAQFDDSGRLTLKFADGKKITSNVAPVVALQSSVVVVNGTTDSTTVDPDLVDESLDGGSATSVFKPIEVVDGGGAA
jgi:hypothetical protein